MKKVLASFFLFLLIAAGLGYLLYPTVADQIAQSRDASFMKAYREKTAALTSEQEEALFAEADAWNGALEGIRAVDIFSAGTPRTSRDYQNHLNIHGGAIGQLVIPKIGVSLPVYHNSSETPVAGHLVHLETSSLPSDRAGTSIILAGPASVPAQSFLGQLGLTDGRMLEDLDQLIPGDLLILNVADRTMVYRVTEAQTLSPAGLAGLDLNPGEGEELLTVMSRKGDRRLVVESARIRIAEARELLAEEDRAAYPEAWQSVLLLGSPVLLLGLIVMFVIERFKKRAYLLPGEGRNAEKRERKARKQLETISTEPVGEEKHDESNQENSERDAGHADADRSSGAGSEQ